MAKLSVGALPAAPRTRTALALESLALRHQILVLKRSGTRRPCCRLIDRLFWILLSRWWPQWRESLMVVQPQTVLRWRRDGWRGLWRYRARGRWRGGRPRICVEIRKLIARMACENFTWGCASDPWRASQAGVDGFAGHHIALYAGAVDQAEHVVADVSS